jgi:N-acetyl-anhydromuramyl-L-alanine amidase AmpD
MKITVKRTPNITKGRTIQPTAILLHHTGGSFVGADAWVMNPQSKVSYHYIVNTDGSIVQYAKPTERTWHAGVSTYKGRSNCNDYMIGIAVSGDTSKRDLTPKEVVSVGELCKELMKDYKIKDITIHSIVSPGRKSDISHKAFKQISDYIYNKV